MYEAKERTISGSMMETRHSLMLPELLIWNSCGMDSVKTKDAGQIRLITWKGLEMAELLTRKIAYEYRDRAKLLPANGLQDIGDRRKLRVELQNRCNLTELQAVNIINGFHITDYVAIEEKKERERLSEEQEESQ